MLVFSAASSFEMVVISMDMLQVVGGILAAAVALCTIATFIWTILRAAKTAGTVTSRFEAKIDTAMIRMDSKADLLSSKMEVLSTSLDSLVRREQTRDAKLDDVNARLVRLETRQDTDRRTNDHP